MANYDVDIEIALRGADKIRSLQADLKSVTKEVGRVNAATIKLGRGLEKNFSRTSIQNVNNYSTAVSRAERALRNAAAGTDAEKRAVSALVTAQKTYNEQLDRQNKLLEEERRIQGVPTTREKKLTTPASTGSNQVSIRSPHASPVFGARNIPGSPMATTFGSAPSGSGGGRAKPSRFGSAVQAGGFPLLFGGGPGQALGGALGGFMTGDIFGPLTIALQVSGGVLDETTQALANLGTALETGEGVVAAYETSIGRLSATKKEYLTNLEASGQKQKLYTEAVKQANEELGVLGDVLIYNAENATSFDRGLDGLVKTLKGLAATPFVFLGTETFGGNDPTKQQEELTRAAKDRLNTAQKEKVALQLSANTQEARLDLERAFTRENINQLSAAQKAEANQERQAAIEAIRAKENQGILEPKHAQQEADKVNIKYNMQLKDIESTRLRNLESFAEKTARLAKENATKKAEDAKAETAAFHARQTAIAEVNLGIIEAGRVREQVLNTDKAALQYVIDKEQKRLENEKLLLAQSNHSLETSLKDHYSQEQIADIIQRRIFLLEEESRMRTLNAQIAIQQIELERQLTDMANDQELQGIGTGLTRQIDDAQQRLATPFSTDESEMLDLRIKQIRRYEDIQTDLNNQLKAQLVLEQSLDKTVRDSASLKIKFLEDQIALYDVLLPQLDAVEQAELRFQQILEKVQPYTDIVARGIVDIFRSMVDGSMDAEEAFAHMLNAIANLLLQKAAVMISTYIAIGIARAFAGIPSGESADYQAMGVPTADANTLASGGSLGWSTDMPTNASVTNPTGFDQLAAGGYVTGPTNALIGEGGEPEFVIPESKMRESMARYSRGARGSAVIPDAGDSAVMGEGGGTAVATPIDVRYTVERINSVDYVTADQFQAGMRQAAQQGAKEGEQKTLKRLQMSGSTRKRLGM